MKHISELIIPGFRYPIIQKWDDIRRTCGMAVYVKSFFFFFFLVSQDVSVMKLKYLKSGMHNHFCVFSL